MEINRKAGDKSMPPADLLLKTKHKKALDASRVTTTAGIVWICAAQFFIAQVIVQSRWTTSFSWATNYISDLGNTKCGLYPAGTDSCVCSPWHTLMNLSFVLQGLIIILGAVLLLIARPAFAGLLSNSCNALFLLLLVVTAFGIAGVGLFPEDVNNGAHVISAGTQFLTGNTAMIVFSSASRGIKGWGAFALVSAALGITGLLATWLFATGYGLGLGVGGMERVAAYPLPIWLITIGVLIVKNRHP